MVAPSTSTVLGCPIHRVTMSEAVQTCLSWVREAGPSRIVLTVNASHLVTAPQEPDLARIIPASELIVADGMSVVWASRWLGEPLPERVAGIDLMSELLDAGAKHRFRVFFLGARPEVVEELQRRVRTQHPGLIIAGSHHGYLTQEDEARVVATIKKSRSDMVFLGMPSPQKERFCLEHREQLHAPVLMGVGGSFDVLAGAVTRAPRWVQGLGMEWFWRFLQEPRRMWKRYLTTNSAFLFRVSRAALARPRGSS